MLLLKSLQPLTYAYQVKARAAAAGAATARLNTRLNNRGGDAEPAYVVIR